MKAFRTLQNPLQNQRGDILLIAIVLTAISLISCLTLLRYAQIMQASSKAPRIKSTMMATEAKVRSELLKPVNYDCPNGRDSCDLSGTIAKINSLSRSLPGAHCPPPSTSCGIKVTVKSFDKNIDDGTGSGLRVTRAVVNIHYEGTDTPLHDIDITSDIPADILQPKSVYQCPQGKPKFNGFNPDGTINCLPLPGRANANEFVQSIGLTGISQSKWTLPNQAKCDNPGGPNYVGSVRWGNGGTDFQITCITRGNPFDVFGFTPQPAPGGDVSYQVNY